MGIRVNVKGYHGVREALRQLGDQIYNNDCHPSGQRLVWYKRRRDYYLKPSILRHRRKQTLFRKKRRLDRLRRYVWLDGGEDHLWPDLPNSLFEEEQIASQERKNEL